MCIINIDSDELVAHAVCQGSQQGRACASNEVQESWNNALIKNVFYQVSSDLSFHNGLHATLILYCQT